MSDRKKEQAVERALTEGYEKYYRLAYSYVHNEADALDIVQEAAYKAILKSDSLKEPQYVETWYTGSWSTRHAASCATGRRARMWRRSRRQVKISMKILI